VERIAAALRERPAEDARYLAAFAYLLGRVANADHAATDAEIDSMRRIVREEGGLSDESAALVVDIARSESLLFRGTEDFRVAQEFRTLATDDQKLALLRCLFAVSASDAAVTTVEDNEIRRISQELKITHADFIAARATVREHLAVLKLVDRRPDRPTQG
jgi:uncharacterized tellurite resistance protein B-like protein